MISYFFAKALACVRFPEPAGPMSTIRGVIGVLVRAVWLTKSSTYKVIDDFN